MTPKKKEIVLLSSGSCKNKFEGTTKAEEKTTPRGIQEISRTDEHQRTTAGRATRYKNCNPTT